MVSVFSKPKPAFVSTIAILIEPILIHASRAAFLCILLALPSVQDNAPVDPSAPLRLFRKLAKTRNDRARERVLVRQQYRVICAIRRRSRGRGSSWKYYDTNSALHDHCPEPIEANRPASLDLKSRRQLSERS